MPSGGRPNRRRGAGPSPGEGPLKVRAMAGPSSGVGRRCSGASVGARGFRWSRGLSLGLRVCGGGEGFCRAEGFCRSRCMRCALLAYFGAFAPKICHGRSHGPCPASSAPVLPVLACDSGPPAAPTPGLLSRASHILPILALRSRPFRFTRRVHPSFPERKLRISLVLRALYLLRRFAFVALAAAHQRPSPAPHPRCPRRNPQCPRQAPPHGIEWVSVVLCSKYPVKPLFNGGAGCYTEGDRR